MFTSLEKQIVILIDFRMFIGNQGANSLRNSCSQCPSHGCATGERTAKIREGHPRVDDHVLRAEGGPWWFPPSAPVIKKLRGKGKDGHRGAPIQKGGQGSGGEKPIMLHIHTALLLLLKLG